MDRNRLKVVRLGVIGGSGVYEMDGVKILREHGIETPFGSPSDLVVEARVGERTLFFIPRHGRSHHLLPSEVNYRANIYALKQLKVTHLLAVNAVGIMQEQIRPGDMVVPDQLFDRTKGVRASTFFGNGIAGHLAFADPFCQEFSHTVAVSGENLEARVHRGGTYVCMEGPQFSTRAESKFYRQRVEPAVIGMTALPEAKLAREAELCYAMLAMGTDYDCWHESEKDVSIEMVIQALKTNAELANRIIQEILKRLPEMSNCDCLSAAKYAIITKSEEISEPVKKRLKVLYGEYLN